MTKQRWALALMLGTPLGLATTATVFAEQSPAFSPATSLGVYAYPRNKQTENQQLKDENKCYGSAKRQTGIDPHAVAATSPAPAPAPSGRQGGTGRGAARGAAAGAAVGAIAGNPGTGAAVGATAGAVRGRQHEKLSQEQAQQQAAAQAQQAQDQRLDTFRRSFSACMDARGYSVK